jgi:hypothetical protein
MNLRHGTVVVCLLLAVCMSQTAAPPRPEAERVAARSAPSDPAADFLDSSRAPPGVTAVEDPFTAGVAPRAVRRPLDPKFFKTKPLDLRAWYPEERARLRTVGLRQSFPNLGSNYVVLAPSTKMYNCIAWTCDVTDRWVWPGDKLSSFDGLYGRLGYRRLQTRDYGVQRGVEKIVLYAKIVNRRVSCTHGACQTPDGKWTSKLGRGALIAHYTPEALNGASYGKPIHVYTRRVPGAVPGSPPDRH